jgi:ribosomal protein S18 acetylase RimI-like enzyme
MDEIEIKRGSLESIDLIQNLWEHLNQLHLNKSPYFKDRYQNLSWGKRKQKLTAKSSDILIEYAVDNKEHKIIGYCISTIDREDKSIGEIDSIYIDEFYRNSGLGKQFIDRAISWLESNNVETQKLLVGVGNEGVLNFYKQFNFYPLHIVLQRVKKKDNTPIQ